MLLALLLVRRAFHPTCHGWNKHVVSNEEEPAPVENENDLGRTYGDVGYEPNEALTKLTEAAKPHAAWTTRRPTLKMDITKSTLWWHAQNYYHL